MTASTCRRYAAVPRTSSIGFADAAASRPNSFAAASLGRCGFSQPASSNRPPAKPSAWVARMIVGPHEPRPTPTRWRARSTTSARPEIEMAIALRVAANMYVCAPPASSHSAATMSSSGRRTDLFGPVMKSAKLTRRSPFLDLRTTVASRAASTGNVSPAGEHVPRFPPIVAALRICGDPIVRAASTSAGEPTSVSSIRVYVTSAPIRTWPLREWSFSSSTRSIATMCVGRCLPKLISTNRSVPPARIVASVRLARFSSTSSTWRDMWTLTPGLSLG